MKRFLGVFVLLVTLTACSSYEVEMLEAQAVEISTYEYSQGILPDATVNVGYYVSMSAIGGPAPFTWKVSAGTFPKGLKLNPVGGATLKILGAPTRAGTYTFTLQAKSSNGQTGSKNFTLVVKP